MLEKYYKPIFGHNLIQSRQWKLCIHIAKFLKYKLQTKTRMRTLIIFTRLAKLKALGNDVLLVDP